LGALTSICSLVCLTGRNPRIFTPLIHLVSLIVMDVERKQLLSQVETLAAVLYTLVVLVDLEQKQNVVLVDFTVHIVFLEEIGDANLDV